MDLPTNRSSIIIKYNTIKNKKYLNYGQSSSATFSLILKR